MIENLICMDDWVWLCEDDLFVSCLSGTAFPGYFQFQARQESQMFAVMEKDVIAGGAGGIGPVLHRNISRPVEHMYIWYTLNIHVNIMYMHGIYIEYSLYM